MQTERGSAIRPAVETLQKANRSCGRARTATSTADHGFTGYLLKKTSPGQTASTRHGE
ncbi:MAG: hypothetical protein JRI35_05975 [Deltaproteobacteria bacterium]|nr:hypothetical protein [Deltaproteobacteria bacterium]